MEVIDNISRLLGDDLKEKVRAGTRIKIAASCFSIYAFEALKTELEKIDSLEFIFTAPAFLADQVTDNLTREHREFLIPKAERERSFYGSEFEIQLKNKLTQRAIAKECADWMRRKAKFSSNRSKAPMQQFACVQNGGDDTVYLPLHGFTAVDLGYQRGDAVSNLVNRLDESSMTSTYISLFDQIWKDPERLEDVTSNLCEQIASVYQDDERGEYGRIFEQEYELLKEEYLSELAIDNEAYRKYLSGINAARTHNGYFAIDKKTNRMKDPDAKKTGEDAGLSDDVDAYDLILKDKERLLSFEEPTRFIFSHSALREGWDNPNVFVMCMLKHSDNTISRRQEVGRGLRISVDRNGERMDLPAIVHDINVLTVVASESYKSFVSGLQTEIAETLSARPRKATEAYFTGKVFETESGPVEITPQMAKQIYRYLVKNDYTDDSDAITETYHKAKEAGELAELTAELMPYTDQIVNLIDCVFDDSKLPKIEDGRKPKTNPLNDNFKKKEFQELWSRINRKAVYRVEFESDELVGKAIKTLNGHLRVTPLQYTVQAGEQSAAITDEQLKSGESFKVTSTSTEQGGAVHSDVSYDLIGNVAENAHLTRRTIAQILSGIQPAVFGQFRLNPEHFIAEASRLINEQKATTIIEKLGYDEVEDRYDTDIFTAAQTGQDFSRASDKLKNHIYDYCVTESDVERRFVEDLDTSEEVVVYAKLPRGFLIPTPVGDYNPDWAISFKRGRVRHIYFVAETKGSMSSMKLREIERTKIECARKFFAEINERINSDKVTYDVVTDYGKLMGIVSKMAA